jgi:hypothetical protein
MLSIGTLIWRSSALDKPSGKIESRLNRSLDCGKDSIRGLARDNEMDKSKFDRLSCPSEMRAVLSVSQRVRTMETLS